MPDWSRGFALAAATAGGLGLIRPAPGTWGSLGAGGLACVWLWQSPASLVWPGLAIAALISVVLGFVTYRSASDAFATHDPGQIVIDEVAGVWCGLAVLPPALLTAQPWLSVLLVVVVFRVFDIRKPGPVGWCDDLPGAVGVMSDDIVAGLMAGMVSLAVLAALN